ncbi:hypothetical protein Q8W71_27355 [Methylobacterium sp. NEAU 140]|uniref:hypothetical protein n=1 Tax=Methylobacterium sp. NEAU 140 TaxID=3064945 RepID=UPI002735F6D3|nr:hypothetical protein [Methylobacterium sp. NEAU 140]MDP4026346.1 hypothetical protein [Methylobacterium sp. NEAU 140]
MRAAFAILAFGCLLQPAAAASGRDYRELMAGYELAWPKCQARTEMYADQNAACRELKSIGKRLSAGGYQIVPDTANPLGFRWD